MDVVKAMGIAWYRPEQYERIRSIMIDGANLSASYEKWLQGAEQGIKTMTEQGWIVERIYIEPDAFIEWCKSRSLNVDSHARQTFVIEAINAKYRKRD